MSWHWGQFAFLSTTFSFYNNENKKKHTWIKEENIDLKKKTVLKKSECSPFETHTHTYEQIFSLVVKF